MPAYGVVQKHGVYGFARRRCPKAKRHVAYPTRDFGPGQVGFNPAGGLNKVNRVVGVFFNAGGNGKDVGVKHDVLRGHTHALRQQGVGALADFNLRW